MRTIAALFLVLASCSANPSTDLVERADKLFVQTFMGSCAIEIGNHDRVRAAAKAMKWKLITDPNARKMLGPADGNQKWTGWLIQQDKRGFMLALTEGEIDNLSVLTCTLVGDVSDVDATKRRIVQLLAADRQANDEANGQRTEVWNFKSERGRQALSSIDAQAMGMKTLNAGIVMNKADFK